MLNDEAEQHPDFLAKTTLHCNCVVALLLAPLIIQNIITQNYTLVIPLSIALALSAINIWFGIQNQYLLKFNTFICLPMFGATLLYSIHIHHISSTYWTFMLVLACYFMLPSRRALLFNSLILAIFIPYTAAILTPDMAIRFSLSLIGTSLFAYLSIREINKLHSILKVEAITDPLTGLFNRSLLEQSLKQIISQHQRTKIPTSLICMDIDHFKKINDTFGHDIGDVVLKRLGELLRKRLRSSDRAFRLGGEEFIILLHNSDQNQSIQFAESLRQQIEQYSFIPLQTITMSFGVVEYEESMDYGEWLKASDVRLYEAKEAGRNNVIG
jgi:diguanylate cyclase (GGDEF)-like protein